MTSTNGQGHTKGPWQAVGAIVQQYEIRDGEKLTGLYVADCRMTDEGKKNAKFIAHACNNFNSLLDACKGLLAKYDFGDDLPEDHPIVAARAALSRVSGSTSSPSQS